jgi:GTPase
MEVTGDFPTADTHCGYVALIGRPNVGKSTLLNRLLGKKVSITSRKPQTTRHRLLGVSTDASAQIVYVDTPGLHREQKQALNRYMNRQARSTLHDVDLLAILVEAGTLTAEDRWILEMIKPLDIPKFLIVNKIDQVKNKNELLPFIEQCESLADFTSIIPVSAKTGNNVERFEKIIKEHLPNNPYFFPPDQTTDRNDAFFMAEFIREQLFRSTGEELPYSTTVEIEKIEEDDKMFRIAALIWVERDGQKKIVIGKQGARLKEIGTKARASMESYLDKKVYLNLWVKVKADWAASKESLARFGYRDE